MISLVGYTGFVGSNILKNWNMDNVYNSKNICEAFDTKPDILIYAGVPAEKYVANKFPEKDLKTIENAFNNIKMIKPKKVVLISTIDVYNNPYNVNEDSDCISDEINIYGKNRLYLERLIEENFDEYLIVRLPALFGENIKKNYIYDYINVIPKLLNETKLFELKKDFTNIGDYYWKNENGFYECKKLCEKEKKELKEKFKKIGYSALNFTDTRAIYQFYDLSLLSKHIQQALNLNIKIFNIATEPIKIEELYYYLTNNTFKNEFLNVVPNYNFKTKHDKLFNGKNGYILDKDIIMKSIKKFIEERN